MNRRSFVRAAGAGTLVSLGLGGEAHATLVRGLTLEELAAESGRILVGRALDSSCQWVTIAGRRRIVTDTRVRVEDVLAKAAPADSEILVRTLGGSIGDVGALVHGEADLLLDESCVVFLRPVADGMHRIIGMAQGHYPVAPDVQRVPRLKRSPRSSEIVGGNRAAIRRLVGLDIDTARRSIHEALKR